MDRPVKNPSDPLTPVGSRTVKFSMDTERIIRGSNTVDPSVVEGRRVKRTKEGGEQINWPIAIKIIDQLYDGKCNKEIAVAVGLPVNRVVHEIYIINRALKVSKRTRLVTLALEQGWIKLKPKEILP